MAYWLVKSEPETWSWQNQQEKKITHWDGVRNFQAAKNLKTMKKGDLCFFYHSGKERQIVGIVKVHQEAYPDPTDDTGRFVMVDVEFFQTFKHPVTLEIIKKTSQLNHLALVRQSRLSVMPIDDNAWQLILSISEAS